MEKTWKSTTAGILSIICGAWGVSSGAVIAVLGGSVTWMVGVPFAAKILGLVGIPMIVLGTVAIVGGVYALKRKVWGLALAGAICAFIVPPAFVLGIPAIIFVVMGKSEFEPKNA